MAGQKGRSGRTTDPETRRARQLAGQKGGRSGATGEFSGAEHDDGTREAERVPHEDAGIVDLLPGKNPYDAVVLKTKGRFSYLDAKVREQSNGELLNNDRKRLEYEIERGKVLTLDAVRSREQARTDLVLSKLSILVDAAVGMHSPEQQPMARHTMDRAVAQFRSAVAEAIRGLA